MRAGLSASSNASIFTGPFVHDHDEHDLRRVGNRRKALQHLDALEAVAGLQPLDDGGGGVGCERRADVDAREPADLGVRRQHVAVDADFGDDFCLARDGWPIAAGRARERAAPARSALAGLARAPGMPTFVVTVASR